MKIKTLCWIASLPIAAVLVLSNASAADGAQTYIGVQYAQFEEDDLDLEPTAAVIRMGSLTDQGYGFEGRFGFGLSSDDVSEFDPFFFGDVVTVDLEIDTLFGAYLVGRADAGAASIYGIIGFTMIDYTIEASVGTLSGSDSDDESDLSYGFGVDFDVSDKVRLNIEYMQYIDKSEIDASAISVGLLF